MFDRASCSTKGARNYQEDSAIAVAGRRLCFRRPGARGRRAELVAILADGMRGHAGGALASRTVCQSFVDAFASTVERDTTTRLISAFSAANDAIAGKVSENPALSGMGSTLVGVVFSKDGAQWVVGRR